MGRVIIPIFMFSFTFIKEIEYFYRIFLISRVPSWSVENKFTSNVLNSFSGNITSLRDSVLNLENKKCVYRRYELQIQQQLEWETIWNNEFFSPCKIESQNSTFILNDLNQDNIEWYSYLKTNVYNPYKMELEKARQFAKIYNGDKKDFDYLNFKFYSDLIGNKYRLIEYFIEENDLIFVCAHLKKIQINSKNKQYLSKNCVSINDNEPIFLSRYLLNDIFYSPRLFFKFMTLLYYFIMIYTIFYIYNLTT